MKRFVAVLCVVVLLACGKKQETTEEHAAKKGEAEEAHSDKHIEEANVVELSVEGQQRVGIVVAPARTETVGAEISATGSIQPIDSRIVHLRPLARGPVQQVLVKVGDVVTKDQVLARIDNIDAVDLLAQINTAKAELARLKIHQANARKQAERSRSLVDIGAVPAKEAEAAESEARALEEGIRAQESTIAGIDARLRRFGVTSEAEAIATAIRAPFAGAVIKAESAPGEVVDSGRVLFSIADLSSVYVDAQVYEQDLGKIRIGQPAHITIDAFPNQRLEGRVAAVNAMLNPATRTAVVRCLIANPGGRLKLEMFAKLVIPTTDTNSALAVHADAVQAINRRTIVFVRKSELHFEAREVEVLGEGPRVEVTAGLKEAEPIVVKGAFQLKSAFLARQLKLEHGHD